MRNKEIKVNSVKGGVYRVARKKPIKYTIDKREDILDRKRLGPSLFRSMYAIINEAIEEVIEEATKKV